MHDTASIMPPRLLPARELTDVGSRDRVRKCEPPRVFGLVRREKSACAMSWRDGLAEPGVIGPIRLAWCCRTRRIASALSLSLLTTTAQSQESSQPSLSRCTARSTSEPFSSVRTISALRRLPTGCGGPLSDSAASVARLRRRDGGRRGGAGLLQPLANGAEVEDAQVQHRNPAIVPPLVRKATASTGVPVSGPGSGLGPLR